VSKLPREWAPAVVRLLEREPAVVRIVIAEARGSAPREPGAFMLVGRDGIEGTIGGGRLEWESIAAARELLVDLSASARLNRVVLGADLGQCCGGVVEVWLERFTRDDVGLLRLASDTEARGPAVLSSTIKGTVVERRVVSEAGAYPRVVRGPAGEVTFLERLGYEFPALWLYGAGHVGQALARILMDLPLRLTWIDSRAELLPAAVPEGVRVRRDPDSLATLADAPPGAYFLVMTHSHPLDYALCHAILTRDNFAWLGLIGSESKGARFRSRLRRAGVEPATIGRLVCPIGVEGIESKWPSAIAVGVAAQVMQQISAERTTRHAELYPQRRLHAAGGECGGEKCSTCGTRPGGAQAGGDARAGVAQVGVAQVGVARAGIAQAGVAQVGVAQAGIAQAGIAQAGVAQAGVAQAGVAQVGDDDALAGGAAQPGVAQASDPESLPAAGAVIPS
jgi:xanthine dehydrogenase accessory factor